MSTTPSRPTAFSSADSAVGYLYQGRLAVQRLASDESFALYLKTFDDVVFETTGSAPDLLQIKHHCDRTTNLADVIPTFGSRFACEWMVEPTE